MKHTNRQHFSAIARSFHSRLFQTVGIAGLTMQITSACDDPLVAPQTIRDLRVLGAQVSALDDPSRASLLPNEKALLRWLVASNRVEAFSATIVLCAARPTTLGVPQCQSGVLLTEQMAGDTQGELEVEFRLPSKLDAGDEWVAFLGLCTDDAPEFNINSSSFRCQDETPLVGFYRALVVSIDAVEASNSGVNHNPNLDQQQLLIDGKDWPVAAQPPQPGEPCGGASLVSVKLGSSTPVELRLLNDDREPLEDEGYGDNQRESLVFTEVATEDGLERAFLAIDHDSDRNSVKNVFNAVDLELDEDGRRVAFYLTALDERGGLSWLTREFCLEP